MAMAMATKRWSDLSPRARRLIVVAGTFEGILKAAALVDVARRSAPQVHGAKWRWAVAIVLVNSVGVVPAVYLVYGRRRA